MEKLFLTSVFSEVAGDIAKKIDCKGLKVAFILTGSEVEKESPPWLAADREALIQIGFNVADYTLTNKTKSDVEKELDGFDVLFFSGGNTFYLLQKLQESNSMDVIKEFVRKGKIYIGSSAGSVVAGPDIYPVRFADDIAKAPKIKGYEGFNLVDFMVLPHWGDQGSKDAYLKGLMPSVYNGERKLILLADHQYVEVIEDFYRIR